ncbi:type VII secretion target [Amycolatopsis sp.]|jgi:hypothetical protein|uniref:type VII secretion target n=1 Tax=Amycolatopsis sp. TaxID=37632 RepID=UPI002E0D0003|nr:type VII secretion target [Amycolatopsis sp.]
MAGGHAVDADQLQQAARVLNEVPKQALEQPLQAVGQSQIVAADFGVQHGDHADAFSAGVRKLAVCARSYLTASADFASRLDDAAKKYGGNEKRATDEMRRH